MKNILFLFLPLVMTACNSEHDLKTKTSSDPIVNTAPVQTFSGGTITDGLDMGMIRFNEKETKTRLVFDSYKWAGYGGEKPTVRSQFSGYYTFKYDPYNHRISATVDGYRGFSSLKRDKKNHFEKSKMIQQLYFEDYFTDSGFKFVIALTQDAKVNVFELKNPGRIIVDIFPIK